jgi:glycosyltransferase involved in cell wall biosynthesis
LDSGNDTRLLEWCLTRIRAQSAGPLYLVYNRSSDEHGLADLLAHLPATPLPIESELNILTLATVVEHIGCDECVVAQLEAAFAPQEMLGQLESFHEDGGYTASTVVGVPPLVAPDVVRAEFLQGIAALNIPGLPRSLRDVLDMFERAGAALDLGFPFKRGQLQYTPGDPDELVPTTLTLQAAGDAETARVVINAAAAQRQPHALLHLWRSETIRRRSHSINSYRHVATTSHKRPRRVLYVSNPSALGGAEENLAQTVRYVDRDRYVPMGLVALEGEFSRKMRSAVDYLLCPNQEFAAPTLENLNYVRGVLRDCRPDIVHNNAHSGMPVLFAASEAGIPVVQHVRIVDTSNWGDTLHAVSRVVAVSQFIKRLVIARDVDEQIVSVIHDGIDTERFAPGTITRDDARRALGLDAEAPVIVVVARVVAAKRHDLAVQAVAMLRARYPDIRLLCVGEVDPTDSTNVAIRDLIRSLGLEQNVILTGFMTDVRVPLAASDVLVLCSDYEALGDCVLEAMAMGVPAVVTKAGGLVEVLNESKSALLIERNDAPALAHAIHSLLDDRHGAAKLAAAGLHYVRRHLTAQVAAGKLADLYDDTLGRGTRTSASALSAG